MSTLSNVTPKEEALAFFTQDLPLASPPKKNTFGVSVGYALL